MVKFHVSFNRKSVQKQLLMSGSGTQGITRLDSNEVLGLDARGG